MLIHAVPCSGLLVTNYKALIPFLVRLTGQGKNRGGHAVVEVLHRKPLKYIFSFYWMIFPPLQAETSKVRLGYSMLLSRVFFRGLAQQGSIIAGVCCMARALWGYYKASLVHRTNIFSEYWECISVLITFTLKMVFQISCDVPKRFWRREGA